MINLNFHASNKEIISIKKQKEKEKKEEKNEEKSIILAGKKKE